MPFLLLPKTQKQENFEDSLVHHPSYYRNSTSGILLKICPSNLSLQPAGIGYLSFHISGQPFWGSYKIVIKSSMEMLVLSSPVRFISISKGNSNNLGFFSREKRFLSLPFRRGGETAVPLYVNAQIYILRVLNHITNSDMCVMIPDPALIALLYG